MKITQSVIPAAGLGTRCLPFTKSIPKEMLPVLGLPAIHHVVAEGIAAGITEFIIITSRRKQALEHYFTPDKELETMLEKSGKRDLLAGIDELISKATFRFVYQDEPRGLGHAIASARPYITDDYFAVQLPDDLVAADEPALAQLVRVNKECNAGVIALMRVADDQLSSYGVVKIGEDRGNHAIAPSARRRVVTISDLVEKPAAGTAPSNLAVLGRYILPKKIVSILHTLAPSNGGEIQLTDAILQLVHDGDPLVGYAISGQWLGTGNPRDLFKANLAMAARDPEYRDLVG